MNAYCCLKLDLKITFLLKAYSRSASHYNLNLFKETILILKLTI